jgi:ABC-type arginine transport system permease subunit
MALSGPRRLAFATVEIVSTENVSAARAPVAGTADRWPFGLLSVPAVLGCAMPPFDQLWLVIIIGLG